jgi:regulator of sigma E protease
LYSWRGRPDPKNLWAPPTQFAISVLPLGGYVKMLGEQDAVADAGQGASSPPVLTEQQLQSALYAKPVHQRAVIFAAGPFANFLLALLLYWLMFMTGVSGLAPVIGRVVEGSVAATAGLRSSDEIISVDGNATDTWQDVNVRLLDKLGESGAIQLEVKNPESTQPRRIALPITQWLTTTEEPNPLADLGIVAFHQVIPARLETVLPEGRAAAAGLVAHDLITGVDGKTVADWNQWLQVIHDHPEQELHVSILRGELPLELSLRPAVRMTESGMPELDANGKEQGYIGAAVTVPELPEWMNRSVRYSPWTAVPQAIQETWDNSVFVLGSMKKMVLGLISLKNLSGPLTIAQVAGQTASIGFEYYISFLAVLSVSLGIFNLLPIPVLDGGHLLYCGIEAVLRRPVPRQLQEWGLQLGLLLVAGFMFLALYNDVSRLL